MRILIIFFISLLASHSWAQEPSPEYRKALEWVTFYYRSPDPSYAQKAIEIFAETKAFSSPRSKGPLIAFFASLFRDNSKSLPIWFESVDKLPIAERDSLYIALWYSGTDFSKQHLSSLSNLYGETLPENRQMLTQPAVSILEEPIRAGASLDMLWGGFFATGDEKYLYKLASVLEEEDRSALKLKQILEAKDVEQSKKDKILGLLRSMGGELDDKGTPADDGDLDLILGKHLTNRKARGEYSQFKEIKTNLNLTDEDVLLISLKSAANWSFGSNASAHKPVFQYCQKRAGKGSRIKRIFLDLHIESLLKSPQFAMRE